MTVESNVCTIGGTGRAVGFAAPWADETAMTIPRRSDVAFSGPALHFA